MVPRKKKCTRHSAPVNFSAGSVPATNLVITPLLILLPGIIGTIISNDFLITPHSLIVYNIGQIDYSENLQAVRKKKHKGFL
jgi:hypothetical protein